MACTIVRVLQIQEDALRMINTYVWNNIFCHEKLRYVYILDLFAIKEMPWNK